jgi:hypothetical protein
MIDDKTQRLHNPNDNWTLRRYAYLPHRVELNMFGSASLGAGEPRRLADQLRAAADAIDPPKRSIPDHPYAYERRRRGGRLPDPGLAAVCDRCGEPREAHGGPKHYGACPGRSGLRAARFRLEATDKP